MKRPVDLKYKMHFGYGLKYPANLKWVTNDGLHHGYDYLTPIGSKVYAPCKGIINKISISPTAGMNMAIKFWIDKDIYRFLFMHLLDIKTKKSVGEWIKEGDLLALSGDSGMAKGHAHLHFQVDKFNIATMEWKHINPMAVGI